jgi:hypothetical protein
VFVPDIHEIENYLLEAAHLAGCALNNGHRTTAAIDARLQTCAASMVWWMACRQVLANLRADFVTDFPQHSHVATQAAAEALICGSPWYQNLRNVIRAAIPAYRIQARLAAAHPVMAAALGNGNWRTTYSGKEMLRNLHGWLYTPPPGSTPADCDRDLARAVGQWQRANGAVPAEVTELRVALRARVGI